MKLLTVILSKKDTNAVCKKLTASGFMFTKMATYGGFLRSANVTLLMGVEDDKTEEAMNIIKSNSKKRTENLPLEAADAAEGISTPAVTVGGATVFIANVERFEKM